MQSKYLLIIAMVFLNSCIATNDEWSCPLRDGQPCKSISEIADRDSKKNLTPNTVATDPILGDKSTLRKEEKVGTLWFAPYVDEQGNKHHESKLSVIIKESEWR